MKRKFFILLGAAFAAVLTAGVAAACAPADENAAVTEGLTYEYTEDGYVVTGLGSNMTVQKYDASGNPQFDADGNPVTETVNSNKYYAETAENKTPYTHISIPAQYEGRPVVGVSSSAFKGHDEIKEIVIPDSVTRIADGAFSELSLEHVTLGTGLEELGQDIFAECDELTEITVKEGCKLIGARMFYGCDKLTEFTLPDGVESIGEEAFANCLVLGHTESNKPDPGLIVLPDTLTSIGRDAFAGSYFYLQWERDPSHFYQTWEGDPSCPLYIGDYLIKADPALAQGTFTVREGTLAIADRALENCTEVSALSLPAGLVSVGEQAFVGCNGLDAITVDADNETYSAAGECLIETATDTLVLGCAASDIPATVTKIGDYAFFGCDRLTDIDLPEGLLSIGDSAFYGCTALQNVTLPASLETLDRYAFADCKAFTEVMLPEKIVSIAESAFSGCEHIKDIVLPAGFLSFETNAFAGCYEVEHIFFRGTQDAWKNVYIRGEENDANLNRKELIYFFFDGTPAGDGNFWHEQGGKPAIW